MSLSLSRAVLIGILLLVAPVFAAELPSPPCGAAPFPDYPPLGEAPHVVLWKNSDLPPGWTPPSCTPWRTTTIVVGLAGHFRYAGAADALLARIGAISSLSAVRYWSVTDKQWVNMFTHAGALVGPNPKNPRGDFSATELRAGGDFYFVAADNRSGRDAVSRLHVTPVDSTHLVLEIENVTPLRWTIFTYAAAGDFQTWYFLDRDTGGDWRFYSLTRVLYANALLGGIIPPNSYINRAVAMYRHLLGLPTDQNPPAAP